MNQDKITEERKEFEAWAVSIRLALEHNWKGYVCSDTQKAWLAWRHKCAEVRELETSVKRYNAERNHYREQYYDAMSREGKLRAEVRELRDRVREWQPIETVELNGAWVLIYSSCGYVGQAFYSIVDKEWGNGEETFYPTHWMPLPEAPTHD